MRPHLRISRPTVVVESHTSKKDSPLGSSPTARGSTTHQTGVAALLLQLQLQALMAHPLMVRLSEVEVDSAEEAVVVTEEEEEEEVVVA